MTTWGAQVDRGHWTALESDGLGSLDIRTVFPPELLLAPSPAA